MGGWEAGGNLAQAVTLLLISPFEEDQVAVRNILSHSNWKLYEASGCREALGLVKRHRIPVVICERDLPDGDWKLLLEELGKLARPPRFIVSSRLAEEHLWAEALNLGAYDVLATPFEASEVFRAVFLAWHSWKHAREQRLVRRKAPQAPKDLQEPSGMWRAASGQ